MAKDTSTPMSSPENTDMPAGISITGTNAIVPAPSVFARYCCEEYLEEVLIASLETELGLFEEYCEALAVAGHRSPKL